MTGLLSHVEVKGRRPIYCNACNLCVNVIRNLIVPVSASPFAIRVGNICNLSKKLGKYKEVKCHVIPFYLLL